MGVAFLCLIDDCQCAVGIFQARSLEYEAADLTVKVKKELFAHRAIMIEQLGMLASFVEPDERVGQIEERDATLANDLQVGWAAERGRLVPLGRDVTAAGDLSDRPGADFARC